MGYIYSAIPRAFCMGEELGIIKNGKFLVVELDEEKFCAIIDKVIRLKKAIKPRDVLRKSILIYLGGSKVTTKFQEKSISQSSLYIKWLQYIENLESFKESSIEATKRDTQIRELRRKASDFCWLMNLYVRSKKKYV